MMKKYPDRKGQSVLVAHTILLSFVVFLIFLVASTFLTLRGEFQDFAISNELEKSCLVIKSGIDKIVFETNYAPLSDTTSTIDIRLPDKIAGSGYSAVFNNDFVFVSTLMPAANTSCRVGLDAVYRGSSAGGLTNIIATRNSTSYLIEMKNI